MGEQQQSESPRAPGADTVPESSALPVQPKPTEDDGTVVMLRGEHGQLIPGKPLDSSVKNVLKLEGYEFLTLLGTGSAGSVYLARQKSLARYVAVKVIHAGLVASDSQLADLESEAKTLATLRHPNIVDCYDIINSDSVLYMVMEYIPGHMTVHGMVERLGTVPPAFMPRLLLDLVKGLAYITQNGFLHRDLKPANLMILHQDDRKTRTYQELFNDTSVRVVICDFGIAKHKEMLEISDTVVGSPMYMSPEQACGEEELDCRSDIYSLGCVAYYMLTGSMPFPPLKDDPLLDYKMDHGVPDPREVNPDVNEALSRMVVKMGRVEPDKRYQNYAELAEELEQLAAEASKWFADSEKKLTRRMRVRYCVYLILALILLQCGWIVYRDIVKPMMQPVMISLSDSLGFWFQEGHAGWKHIFVELHEPTDFMRSWKGKHRVPLVLMQPLKDGMSMDFCLRFFGPGKVACGFQKGNGAVLMAMEWERKTNARDRVRLRAPDANVPCGVIKQKSQLDWEHFNLKLDGNRLVVKLHDKPIGALYLETPEPECYFFVDTTMADAADLKNVYRMECE